MVKKKRNGGRKELKEPHDIILYFFYKNKIVILMCNPTQTNITCVTVVSMKIWKHDFGATLLRF